MCKAIDRESEPQVSKPVYEDGAGREKWPFPRITGRWCNPKAVRPPIPQGVVVRTLQRGHLMENNQVPPLLKCYSVTLGDFWYVLIPLLALY